MTDPDTTHDRAERIATSIRDRLGDDESSRRGFLTRSAVTGGSLLALTGATGLAFAQADDEAEDGMDGENETPAAAFENVDGTDLDVLNYALTLEHLEDAFYQQGLEMFSEEDFANAEALQSQPEEARQAVYGYVQTVGEHESIHAQVLTQAVDLLGGVPAEPSTYDFGFESVDEMLALGQTIENTGVGAYAGVAPLVESPDLLSAALAIHSVEARHAAVFNYLTGTSPFPNAFDQALDPATVLDAVSGFYATMPDEMPGDVDGNVTDGANGNVTDGANGNVTDGANGNVTDGANGNVTDGANGNATDGDTTDENDTAGG